MCIHITACRTSSVASLTEHERASWIWSKLRKAFPAALAAVLMPNHIHVLSPSECPDAAQRRLRDVLGGFTRHQHPGSAVPVWVPPPIPTTIPDRRHLARQVRYVALNPCRAGLAPDPLTWPWSTHRDVIGAISHPWVPAERLWGSASSPQRFAVSP